MESTSEGWRRCSVCKNGIGFEATWWACNVSTCNRKRTGLYFCSVECWEVHLPGANHREAWALEKRAPNERQARAEAAAEARAKPRESSPPRRRPVRPDPTPTRDAASASRAPTPTAQSSAEPASHPPAELSDDTPTEILIVASRLKEYIRARSGMNTSERALAPLSQIVREVCDRAIQNAAKDGRKTVLDRDVPS